ncbi:MAG: ATP synthase F0 subunit B [Candidatus Aminicenantales bacterium]
MPGKKPVLAVLLVIPLILNMTAGEGSKASGAGEMIGKIINFAVLFGGLFFILRKPLRDYLAKRTRDIQSALTEARDARLEAERKLDDIRQRIARLEDEAARLRKDAELEGLKEKERIEALAEKEAGRIRSFTRQEIESQLKAGIQELKEFTTEKAASLAEAGLKDKITKEGQSVLIDKSIEKLADLYEKSSSG